YKKLVQEAAKAMEGKGAPDSITCVWMQGERDSREDYGAEYGEALEGLWKQLVKTYGREDIDFVLGRLSDHGIDNASLPGWDEVRRAQEAFAEKDPKHRVWIDTDS